MTALTIAVASGKGGTGKTSVAASLALSAPSAQYIDCDVETPNGHLFLRPEIQRRGEVRMRTPQMDPSLCTLCGACAEACEFNALAVTRDKVLVFAELCHGCGVCAYLCPVEGAVTEVQRGIGLLEMGQAKGADATQLQFAKGRLNVGETGSVGVIKAVKQHATHDGLRVLDAPAGTACPMVETVQGADYCVLVTEPTPFGLHDLKLAVEVVRRLGVPCGVVLNRCDIGDDRVKDYCETEGLPLLMEIPFERSLAEAYARGLPWVEARPEYRDRFHGLLEAIQGELEP
ncbi:ATP-binding protein [Thiorhodococcus minor]|uniref:(4Fe-4S)-binding protein n=1 Tax=Thiorhodococcus minor TaxID=57489 RepID=A0A6M0K2Q7_9GAMM|nr:ATP-binding protein [Thiorhodococcus minor]NEV63669.1 (4Fe-4S)-binding protein [Thiorhodococcus minor]